MNPKEIRIEHIEGLFAEYGVGNKELVADSICKYVNSFMPTLINDNPNRKLELAEMLYFIKGIGDEINIKGTITEPKRNEIKNTERKANLKVSAIRNDIEVMLTETLRKEYGMETQLDIHYNEKECVDDDFYSKIEEGYFTSDSFLKLPYTNEELEQIIRQGKKDEEINKTFTINRKLGLICNKILHVLEQNKVMGDNTTTIKEYSMIYDIIALTGYASKIHTDKPYSGRKAKEKYDWVKNKINSFISNWDSIRDCDVWVVEIVD